MPATDELVSSFDKSWKNFSKAWKEASATASEKSVHDLRVSTRRLIATLELTRALSKHDEIANLQRRFKKVLKRMGPLRDVQVQLETVSKMHQIGAIKEFERDLDRRERREIDSLSKELKRGRKQRLCKEVEDARAEFQKWSAKKGNIIAMAPALQRLEQKRESLLKKIIESSTAFEEKLQTENRQPPVTETTRAVAAPAIAP